MAEAIRFFCTHPDCLRSQKDKGKTYSFATVFEHMATHLPKEQRKDMMDYVCNCGGLFLTKAFAVAHLASHNDESHKVTRSTRDEPRFPIADQQNLLEASRKLTNEYLRYYVKVASLGGSGEAPPERVEQPHHSGRSRPEQRRPPNINVETQQYNHSNGNHQSQHSNFSVERPATVNAEQQQRHNPLAAQARYEPASPPPPPQGYESPQSYQGSPGGAHEVNTPCYSLNSPPKSPSASANMDSDDDEVPQKKEVKPRFFSDAYGASSENERVKAPEAKFGNFYRDAANKNGEATTSNSHDSHNGGPGQYGQAIPASSRGPAGDAPRFHSDAYGQQNHNHFQQNDVFRQQNFNQQQQRGPISAHFEHQNRDEGRGRASGNNGIPARDGGKQTEEAQMHAQKHPFFENSRGRDSNENQHHLSGDSHHQQDFRRHETRPQPAPIHPYETPLDIPLPPPPPAHPPRSRPSNQANDVPPEKRRRWDERQEVPRPVPPPQQLPTKNSAPPSMGARPNDTRPATVTDAKGMFMPSTRPIPVRNPDAPRLSTSSVSMIIKNQARLKPADAAFNNTDSPDDTKTPRQSRTTERNPGPGSWGGGTSSSKVQLMPFADVERRIPTPPRGRSRSRSASRAPSPGLVGAISDGSRRRGRPPRGSKNGTGSRAASRATTPARERSQGPRSRATTPARDRSQGPRSRSPSRSGRRNHTPERLPSPKNGYNYFEHYKRRSKK